MQAKRRGFRGDGSGTCLGRSLRRPKGKRELPRQLIPILLTLVAVRVGMAVVSQVRTYTEVGAAGLMVLTILVLIGEASDHACFSVSGRVTEVTHPEHDVICDVGLMVLTPSWCSSVHEGSCHARLDDRVTQVTGMTCRVRDMGCQARSWRTSGPRTSSWGRSPSRSASSSSRSPTSGCLASADCRLFQRAHEPSPTSARQEAL